MAGRLLDSGHDLVVFDVDADAMRTLADLGAATARSPREVADTADIVFMSLPTPAVVLEVALGEDGLVHGTRARHVVDLSTTGSPTSARVADALATHDVCLVDSPVSGGVTGAAKGTLAVMTACPDSQFALVEPILAQLGRVFHVGATPGLGQAMKLLNNYLSATALAVTAEAFVFGAKAGLDADTMVEVVNAGSGRNSATQDKFPRAILPGTFDFGFAIGLMYKDVALFAEQADTLGVPLFTGSAVRQLWQFARDQMGADADFTTIVRPLEQWSGVEVRSLRRTDE
jgi:3-hydroxyisobutyrate dehydrogenase-like beta-hydroxyacid dehydrogenase